MRSNSLELDTAFDQPDRRISLSEQPTPAQLGALRCHSRAGRSTNLDDFDDTTDSVENVTQRWREDDPSFWDEFSDALSAWSASSDPAAGASIGFWLTSVRLSGISRPQTLSLTRFLAEPAFSRNPTTSRSVRRYPTGGVSEKQAILLPAVLRLLSGDAHFHSSFLIARRLGHTGGTSDKLRILPGFVVQPASELAEWTGAPPAVRYFTADAEFCPRDEALYFLRGETGTVRQVGLITASIIAKQYALRADLTLIDVLYGDGAFFDSPDAADRFIREATAVCSDLGLPIELSRRPTSSIAWRSIGNAAEIVEILHELATPRPAGAPPRSELDQAITFAARLAEASGLPAESVRGRIEDAWCSGELMQNLVALWHEHSVDTDFLARLQVDPDAAILGGLHVSESPATTSGVVGTRSVVELADLVNTRLNGYATGTPGLPTRLGVGGLTLGVALGETIESGQNLFRVHSSDPIDPRVVDAVAANLTVTPVAA